MAYRESVGALIPRISAMPADEKLEGEAAA